MYYLFPKYIDIEDFIKRWRPGEMNSDYFSLSTGITDNDFKQLKQSFYKLSNAGIIVKFICIDVANGYMFKFVEFCKKIRDEFPETPIAGNVVSREMVEELIINGKVDTVKVGIGFVLYVPGPNRSRNARFLL